MESGVRNSSNETRDAGGDSCVVLRVHRTAISILVALVVSKSLMRNRDAENTYNADSKSIHNDRFLYSAVSVLKNLRPAI